MGAGAHSWKDRFTAGATGTGNHLQVFSHHPMQFAKSIEKSDIMRIANLWMRTAPLPWGHAWPLPSLNHAAVPLASQDASRWFRSGSGGLVRAGSSVPVGGGRPLEAGARSSGLLIRGMICPPLVVRKTLPKDAAGVGIPQTWGCPCQGQPLGSLNHARCRVRTSDILCVRQALYR